MKTAKTSDKKALIAPILEFVVAESEERSRMYADLIVNFMKKEDGEALKPPLRGAAILCRVEDSLTEWRVDLVMGKIIAEMQVPCKSLSHSHRPSRSSRMPSICSRYHHRHHS
jgi:hypothetical protein